MSWKKLQAEGKVQVHKTSKKELDDLRAVIVRDMEDAAIQELSDDRRFASAYNAALQAAKMSIACAGFRLAGTQGHHRLTFEASGWHWELQPRGHSISLRPVGGNAT